MNADRGLLARLGVQRPVVQAGMGGGLSRHELAVAVSQAGGLGTIGLLDPGELRAEIAAFRRESDRPLAVNLLLPLVRGAHFDAASEADVVVTFWGRPERRTQRTWIHQCASVEEAVAARDAGADAVIAQGVEAGGHVRGTAPAAEVLAGVRDRLGDGYPVLSAGGVADAADAAARLAAGAEAVVCGTRFLMTEQSGAHPLYKRRLLDSDETILTELFGMGWPAPHRVVPNAATARWVGGGAGIPGWMRALHRAGVPLASRLPVSLQTRAAAAQRPATPLLGPVAATADGPASLVEAGPLYAGECIARIGDIADAGDVVRTLAPG